MNRKVRVTEKTYATLSALAYLRATVNMLREATTYVSIVTPEHEDEMKKALLTVAEIRDTYFSKIDTTENKS